jgi:hypothetical protein
MMLLQVLALTQYPIQKVINGDSVVIMTTQQGRDVNAKFERQKRKINELNRQIDSLKQLATTPTKETLYVSENTNQYYYESKLLKLDTLEHWLHNVAAQSSLVFYFEGQIVAIDLSEFSLKNIYKGGFHFVRRKPRYLKEGNSDNDQPVRKWELVLINSKLRYKKIKI